MQQRPYSSRSKPPGKESHDFDTENVSTTIKFIRDHFQTRNFNCTATEALGAKVTEANFKSFIFPLLDKEGIAPFKSMVTNISFAIYRGSSYGPTFLVGGMTSTLLIMPIRILIPILQSWPELVTSHQTRLRYFISLESLVKG